MKETRHPILIIPRQFWVLIALMSIFMLTVFVSNVLAQTNTLDIAGRRAQLESELEKLEKEIDVQKSILQVKQKETVSLERDVNILNVQINESELRIKSRNLTIQKIKDDAESKEKLIDSLSQKLDREKESLAQLIRKTNEIDAFSLVEVIFSNKDISEFFIDLDSFDSIKAGLQDSFVTIKETKNTTTEQKKALEEEKIEQSKLRTLQKLQQNRIEDKRYERKQILRTTKGEERIYQKILESKQRDAATIRNTLFALRDTAAIPFGKAVEFANKASRQTGVRPALILGIITQESNLGENTGQCLLKNKTTGSGIGKNTGRFFKTVMKPGRDTIPFLELSKRIGFDPYNTPVSCPPSYGYGGAMGPAQFIPSTWVLFEKKIAKLTGNSIPNPWSPEDAFMASAVLLRDNGASKGGYTAERLSALRYFAGWRNAQKTAYAFYGNDVMKLAEKIQKQIDIIEAM